jgi:hypothetical protein
MPANTDTPATRPKFPNTEYAQCCWHCRFCRHSDEACMLFGGEPVESTDICTQFEWRHGVGHE